MPEPLDDALAICRPTLRYLVQIKIRRLPVRLPPDSPPPSSPPSPPSGPSSSDEDSPPHHPKRRRRRRNRPRRERGTPTPELRLSGSPPRHGAASPAETSAPRQTAGGFNPTLGCEPKAVALTATAQVPPPQAPQTLTATAQLPNSQGIQDVRDAGSWAALHAPARETEAIELLPPVLSGDGPHVSLDSPRVDPSLLLVTALQDLSCDGPLVPANTDDPMCEEASLRFSPPAATTDIMAFEPSGQQEGPNLGEGRDLIVPWMPYPRRTSRARTRTC